MLSGSVKIHITGNAGAGKTTLAREISILRNLELHHLDSYVWGPKWTKVDPDTRDAAIRSICETDDWIIEGVSKIVRDRADVVVFIDSSRYLCMARCILRCLTIGMKTRPELPEPCPELYVLFKAIRLTYTFPRLAGAEIRNEANSRLNYFVTKDVESARRYLRCYTDTA